MKPHPPSTSTEGPEGLAKGDESGALFDGAPLLLLLLLADAGTAAAAEAGMGAGGDADADAAAAPALSTGADSDPCASSSDSGGGGGGGDSSPSAWWITGAASPFVCTCGGASDDMAAEADEWAGTSLRMVTGCAQAESAQRVEQRSAVRQIHSEAEAADAASALERL